MKTCAKCNLTDADDKKFCLKCGAPLTMIHQIEPKEGLNGLAQECLSCHGEVARSVEYFNHPRDLLLISPKEVVGVSINLYSKNGQHVDSKTVGEISCGSCHNPHNWGVYEEAESTEAKNKEGDITTSFLRDGWQTITFCASCHGQEGLRRYIYFHKGFVRSLPATETETTTEPETKTETETK